MKVVIQRVKEAQVMVDEKTVGSIKSGMVIFLGIGKGDAAGDIDYLVNKLIHLRIFEDSAGKMNRSALEAGGEFLVISQFTLLGNCSRGRRPSFDEAAEPAIAEQLYERFLGELRKHNLTVATGQFRAMMDVSLVNDGPVTFILDSKRIDE